MRRVSDGEGGLRSDSPTRINCLGDEGWRGRKFSDSKHGVFYRSMIVCDSIYYGVLTFFEKAVLAARKFMKRDLSLSDFTIELPNMNKRSKSMNSVALSLMADGR